MKKTFYTLLLVLASGSLFAANTWYSTGLSSTFSDPQAWSLDAVVLDQRGLPAEDDHLVIRHPLTWTVEGVVARSGDLRIEAEGVLELLGRGQGATLALTGAALQNDGILMSNVLIMLNGGSLELKEGAQTLLGGDLSLEGDARMAIDNGSCGALLVKGRLMIHGEMVKVLGKGGWIVEGGYRVWDANDNEVLDIMARANAMAALMQEGLTLFSALDMCATHQRGLEGSLDPLDLIGVEREAKATHLSLYPNPRSAQDLINVAGTGFEPNEAVVMEVRTLFGQMVTAVEGQSDETGRASLSGNFHLEPGQYLVTIRGSKHLATQWLICQ